MTRDELEEIITEESRNNICYVHTMLGEEKLCKLVCGFLNTNGGKIIFGIKDDGLNLHVKKSVFSVEASYQKLLSVFIDCASNLKYGKYEINGNNIECIEIEKSNKEQTYKGIVYYFSNTEREAVEKKTVSVFLSYCQKDKGIANIIDKRLVEIDSRISITRDIRVVNYRESFSAFMQTITEKDYVISLVSDRYLKSRNCMYEICELMRNRNYVEKLLFIVISDEDEKYCLAEDISGVTCGIGAHIYDVVRQGDYVIYWKDKEKELEELISKINDPIASRNQIEELEVVRKIKTNIRDFMKELTDKKGICFEDMLKSDFAYMTKIMIRD